ncbi:MULTISPECIES: hypothetical protein [unclassified Streptomyces]|uniref:hypothetical protein n=1 Tax=unclassified Streptomyces TaxID=2593676 RepID=UPI002DD8B66C|nr:MULTISPECIES: hypothetical protein [unclassified Streptomyces]WSF90317.1 hypothetical protein OIE70_00270 [Streptomyces sp. NBC_01744]WSC42519.1 hypothetical protein OHA08_00260 [Streptomyces sp. NBC_01763]WSC42543.1 hypothetical protein OHA08_44720 [Streptomyces sp. NBC_01763]WSC59184.1 hypothetical protein OG808_00260 [Streptomyces sp. NBC_01761]WSC59211.1 hypothetical protein OG808_44055 [Streptomyces sp. NBC_01761]
MEQPSDGGAVLVVGEVFQPAAAFGHVGGVVGLGRDPSAVRAWREACRWEDAMRPVAVSKGLWSVNRSTYRNQRLGGPYDAAAKCRALLENLRHLADLAQAIP